jgi:hypothetical protein
MRANGRSVTISISIAVVTMLGGAGCGGQDPPEASPGSPPTASAPASPSGSSALPVLSGPCCYGLALEPGRYETPSWFEPGFTIEVGDGMLGVAAELERTMLLGRGQSRAGNLQSYAGFFVAPSADALTRRLRATPFTRQGDASATTVGAMPAVSFEARSLRDPGTPPNAEIVPGAIRIPAIDRLVPTFFYTESVPARMRFVVVDLGDRALLIYVEAPASRFDAFAEEVATAIESIAFQA